MAIGYVQLANGDANFTPANDGVWDNTIDTDDFGLGIPKPCVLEILLENKTLREEMGEKAGEFSKKFRWKNSIEKLERIFHKMDNLIKADHLSRKVSSKG